MVDPSFEWAEVFGAGDHGLLHVAVFDRNNPGDALALLNEARASMEPSVRHAALLTTIEDDGHAVTRFVVVHDTTDVQAASLVLSSSQDASGSYALTL